MIKGASPTTALTGKVGPWGPILADCLFDRSKTRRIIMTKAWWMLAVIASTAVAALSPAQAEDETVPGK